MPRRYHARMNDTDELFDFPCDFPVKVMGRQDASFEAHVVMIARRHFPDLGEGAVRSRASRNGNYLAVTVTVRAENRAQLDAFYRELTADAAVLMVL